MSIIPSAPTGREGRLRGLAQLEQKASELEGEQVLRKSQEQFRLLVEAVQDYAIFMLDPQGHVSSWNPGAERINQYKAAEIIGKHFSCFFEEEDVRRGKPAWELATAVEHGRVQDEGWRVRKDGSEFWANVTLSAVRDTSGKLLGFAKVTRDVTEAMQTQQALQKEVAERRETQKQLHRSEESLRQLSLHLLRTQDEERRRIGSDLHDSLGQYLSVLKLKLGWLATAKEPLSAEMAEDVAQCLHLADDCIKELRTMSYLLYPPLLEQMGLESAIPWYLEGFSGRSGIETTLEIQPSFGRLPSDLELALFRVLQESLTNIHRHSGSKTACVRLQMKDGMAILEVQDFGVGVPPQLLEQSGQGWMGAHGVGLRGMSERIGQLGGKLELISNECGTTITAVVPAIESQPARES